MKNSKLRFILAGIAAGILLTALGVMALWVLDTVFSGTLKEFYLSFIDGYDDTRSMFFLNNVRLMIFAFVFIVFFAAALSATGAVCAYVVYKKQNALLLRAREDAQRAQALAEMEMARKSDLITYLAHDLKTPLSSVTAYLGLLTESPELLPEQRAKYTGIALDKAYRLEQLIDELFEIIRFNLQSMTLNQESINVRLMLEQLADAFYPILLAQGKRVIVACDERLSLRGDPDKLARVFNNILKNAAAYSYENSEIRAEARAEGNKIAFRFTNRGDPIPEEKRRLIFEKFYRLDGARSSKTGGAGLGLAIAKQIVEAHGGSIRVESNATQTVFEVILPENGR